MGDCSEGILIKHFARQKDHMVTPILGKWFHLLTPILVIQQRMSKIVVIKRGKAVCSDSNQYNYSYAEWLAIIFSV